MSDRKISDVKISRFMSLVLRHNPEAIGISLDNNGWADVRELISGICNSGRQIDMETLERIVAENDKQRFSFNDNHTKIRANQGHSISVDVELSESEPPDVLYHGTAVRFLDSIRKNGILKRNRQYVHLSSDIQTARDVGKRHGKPVVLPIDTKKMRADGHIFYLSANHVWLCDDIAWRYIKESEIIYSDES